jgi:hypothetical protein
VAQQTPVIGFIQNKEKYMGRKGVSKRKPKRPFSSADIDGSSNNGSNQRSPVQSFVKDKAAPFNINRDVMNPSAESTKSQKKR